MVKSFDFHSVVPGSNPGGGNFFNTFSKSLEVSKNSGNKPDFNSCYSTTLSKDSLKINPIPEGERREIGMKTTLLKF